LLGGCELTIRDQSVALRRSAGLQIMAFLALHPDGATTSDLIRAVWPGLQPSTITNRLHKWILLDPAARQLYVDWARIAAEMVAILRLDAGAHPDDPRTTELVGELMMKSPEFSQWWDQHKVLNRTWGDKRFRHPVVGPLEIDYEALHLPGDTESAEA
jgi:hypothetical protein